MALRCLAAGLMRVQSANIRSEPGTVPSWGTQPNLAKSNFIIFFADFSFKELSLMNSCLISRCYATWWRSLGASCRAVRRALGARGARRSAAARRCAARCGAWRAAGPRARPRAPTTSAPPVLLLPYPPPYDAKQPYCHRKVPRLSIGSTWVRIPAVTD